MRPSTHPMWHPAQACLALVVACSAAPGARAQINGAPCVFSDGFGVPDAPMPVSLVERAGILYASMPGGELAVFDVTDPGGIVQIGSLQIPDGDLGDGTAETIELTESLLYLGATGVGLVIVDITVPSAPSVVSTSDLGLTLPSFRGSALEGNTLYLSGTTELHVVDVSDPAMPLRTSTLALPTEVLYPRLEIRFDRLYAAGGDLAVFDIAQAQSPQHLGTVATPGHSLDCQPQLAGVFVSGDTSELISYDLSDPHQPTVLASLTLPGSTNAIEINGETIVVSGEGPRLYVVDSLIPDAPQLIRTVAAPHSYDDLAIHDEVAYGGTLLGLGPMVGHRLSGQLPPSPVVGSLGTPGEANAVAIEGSLFITANEDSGIRIFDVSNPQAPSLVGIFADTFDFNALAVVGDLAFTSERTYGFRTLDISDPAQPVRISPQQGELVSDIRASEGRIYIAEQGGKVRVMDVSNPQMPAIIDYPNLGTGSDLFCVEGTMAYIVEDDRFTEITVVDFADPSQPVNLGTIEAVSFTGPLFREWADVEVYDARVYAADDEGWLWVLDLGNPSDGQQYPLTLPIDDSFRRVQIEGDVMFLSGDSMATRVYRFDAEGVPLWLGSLEGGTGLREMLVRDNVVYSARPGEIAVFDLGDDCPSSCPADTNRDGLLTPADFSTWIAAFNAQSPACDQNDDGLCTPSDFSVWIANYNAGC